MKPSSIVKAKTPYGLFLILFFVLAMYGRVIHFEMLQLDDPKHIFENPVFGLSLWRGLIQFWTEPFLGLYIPVTYSAWLVLGNISQALFGRLEPGLFHFANLLVHLINCTLLYQVLEKICVRLFSKDENATGAILLGVAIFALHPLQVETVSWISCLKDLLAVGFGLAALRMVIEERKKAALLFFGLSLLSKPTLVLLPLLAAVLGRVLRKVKFSQANKELLPWWGLSLIVGVLTKHLQPTLDLTPSTWPGE